MILLELRDGNIIIPKTEFDTIFKFDWFLSHLVQYDFNIDNKEYQNKFTLWESKSAVLSILDSIRYNKLIIYDNTNLEYLESLADKWCLPKWLIELIDETKKNNLEIEDNSKSKIKNLNMTFKCIICLSGFNYFDNAIPKCISHKLHLKWLPNQESHFPCCGQSQEIGKDNPCNRGYHVASIADRQIAQEMINN